MSAIVHQDLIDASELYSLLQRLTTAQNDKERLRHLKTAARNYTFDGGQIARLLAPMAASPAAAVEAAVMLLRAVPRAADPAAVETAVAALVYDEQRADVKRGSASARATLPTRPSRSRWARRRRTRRPGFADRSGPSLSTARRSDGRRRGVTMSVPVKVAFHNPADDNKVCLRDDGRRESSGGAGMDRAARRLPQWRQIALKKEKGSRGASVRCGPPRVARMAARVSFIDAAHSSLSLIFPGHSLAWRSHQGRRHNALHHELLEVAHRARPRRARRGPSALRPRNVTAHYSTASDPM